MKTLCLLIMEKTSKINAFLLLTFDENYVSLANMIKTYIMKEENLYYGT